MIWLIPVVLFVALIPAVLAVQYHRAVPDEVIAGFKVRFDGALTPWPGLAPTLTAARMIMGRTPEVWVIVLPPWADLGRNGDLTGRTTIRGFYWGLKKVAVVEVKQFDRGLGPSSAIESALPHELGAHVLPWAREGHLNVGHHKMWDVWAKEIQRRALRIV